MCCGSSEWFISDQWWTSGKDFFLRLLITTFISTSLHNWGLIFFFFCVYVCKVPVALLISQIQSDVGGSQLRFSQVVDMFHEFSHVVCCLTLVVQLLICFIPLWLSASFKRHFRIMNLQMHFICNRASFVRFSGLFVDPDLFEISANIFQNW